MTFSSQRDLDHVVSPVGGNDRQLRSTQSRSRSHSQKVVNSV